MSRFGKSRVKDQAAAAGIAFKHVPTGACRHMQIGKEPPRAVGRDISPYLDFSFFGSEAMLLAITLS